MNQCKRLRRSLAWAMALKPEELKQLIAGCCDGIVLDLEDGVLITQKETARTATCQILQNLNFGKKERIVRVNPVDSKFFESDMTEVIAKGLPDAIRLPKCEHTEDVLMVERMLTQIEKDNNMTQNTIEILAMIETPLGVRNAYDIAVCCKRVTALSLGMEDMCREFGVKRRYENNALDMLYLRQKLVLDAKAAGVQILDSALLNFDDIESTRREAVESKQTGFTGRSVQGNEQAKLVNDIFTPDAEEVEDARGMVAAYEDAGAHGDTGHIMYHGKLVCYAAYTHACDLLRYALQIEDRQ